MSDVGRKWQTIFSTIIRYALAAVFALQMTFMNVHKILSLLTRQTIRSYGMRGVVFFSLLTFHCNESLPPRDEPQHVLSVKLSVTDGIFVFRERERLPPLKPYWDITRMTMSIRVQNDYSDVLQDTLRMAGSIEIWNRLDPTVRAKYTFGKDVTVTVIPRWVLTRGVLTLEPGDFASLGMEWTHFVQEPVRRPVWCGRELTPHVNLSGEVYYVSDRALLGIKAKVQVFRKVALLSTNQVNAEVEYWIYPLPSSPPPDSTLCQQPDSTLYQQ